MDATVGPLTVTVTSRGNAWYTDVEITIINTGTTGIGPWRLEFDLAPGAELVQIGTPPPKATGTVTQLSGGAMPDYPSVTVDEETHHVVVTSEQAIAPGTSRSLPFGIAAFGRVSSLIPTNARASDAS
jgi:hypothetical protein